MTPTTAVSCAMFPSATVAPSSEPTTKSTASLLVPWEAAQPSSSSKFSPTSMMASNSLVAPLQSSSPRLPTVVMTASITIRGGAVKASSGSLSRTAIRVTAVNTMATSMTTPACPSPNQLSTTPPSLVVASMLATGLVPSTSATTPEQNITTASSPTSMAVPSMSLMTAWQELRPVMWISATTCSGPLVLGIAPRPLPMPMRRSSSLKPIASIRLPIPN